jgi:hypothetical protein
MKQTTDPRYDAGGETALPAKGEPRSLLYQYVDYCIDLLMQNGGDDVLFVTGQVTNVVTGQPVPGVEIGSGDAKGTSCANGRFAVALPATNEPLQFRIRTADLDVIGNIPLVAGMYAA